MKRQTAIWALLILSGALAVAKNPPEHNFKPKDGYVPNQETAIAIATAVWAPIYGKDNIKRQQPYSAKLINGIWVVEGTLPANMKGGVAVAQISKDDGRIISVSHGK